MGVPPIDLSHISVNKGTNLRLRWTKYSDLCEILYLCSQERNEGKVHGCLVCIIPRKSEFCRAS